MKRTGSKLAILAAVIGVFFGQSMALAAAPATTTTLALTSGGSAVTTVQAGAAITLTATVSAGTSPVTAGQVNFCNGASGKCTGGFVVGSATLNASGTATVVLHPKAGQLSYSATFLPNTNGATSSSSAVALTVTGGAATKATTTTTLTSTGSVGGLQPVIHGDQPRLDPADHRYGFLRGREQSQHGCGLSHARHQRLLAGLESGQDHQPVGRTHHQLAGDR